MDMLMRPQGRIVPRLDLLEEIWGFGRSDSKTLDQHIRRLRRSSTRSTELRRSRPYEGSGIEWSREDLSGEPDHFGVFGSGFWRATSRPGAGPSFVFSCCSGFVAEQHLEVAQGKCDHVRLDAHQGQPRIVLDVELDADLGRETAQHTILEFWRGFIHIGTVWVGQPQVIVKCGEPVLGRQTLNALGCGVSR